MRITVGGIIFVCGTAGASYFGLQHMDALSGVSEALKGVQDKAVTLMGLGDSQPDVFGPGRKEGQSDGVNEEVKSMDVDPISEEGIPPLLEEPKGIIPVESPTDPIPKNLVPKTKPKPKAKKSVKKSVPKLKTTPVPKTEPAKATEAPITKSVPAGTLSEPKNSVSNLVGSYVTLELTSGRNIKGILEGKTQTEYRLELPGLGTFKYPIENVKNISPAE